ncbi:MAG: hypothetical protein LBT35_00015 [Tannerella sp.]|jgi:hypothetical protein|nr:hypothetical protein [Tannerella sp.]
MDFITAPLIVGMISYFTYMVFELFGRRKERLTLIEKIGQNLNPIDSSVLSSNFSSLLPAFPRKSFTGMRIGCLLFGLGVGLLTGLFLNLHVHDIHQDYHRWDNYSVAYAAPMLIFGGIGLIISYIIERKEK